MTIKELKQARDNIIKYNNVSQETASRIIADFNKRGDDNALALLRDGDMSPLSDIKRDLDLNESKKEKPPKNTSQKKTQDKIVPFVDGEVVNDDFLPPSVIDDINDIISNCCIQSKIDDLSKASAEKWKGICIACGRYFKQSTILRDTKRERLEGGKRYNAQKIADLLEIWACLCLEYDKVPLICDFAYFSGVSEAWLRNNNGSCELSSASVDIWKRLLTLQESGLSSRLIDGKRNPTGVIFFLKNNHGWRDQREIVHTDGGASSPVNYPTFGAIEDKTGAPVDEI